MKTSLLRMAALVVTIAPFLAFFPTVASAATVTVMVGNGGFFFSPSSVTIQPGDTVQWTWSSSGHSSTSGTPGSPSGFWDSGLRNQGQMFSQTFNTAGSFPYYCTPHGQCCGMVGTVTVNPTPTPTPTPTATPTPTPGPATLGNISTRLQVGTGDRVMIAGFIVQGSPPKTVLIRALGPSLTQFGVPDVLANPQLELHDVNSLIGMNNDWQTTQIGGVITSDQVMEIQNSGLAPSDPLESALIATLPPGSYTAIVSGVNNTTGNALAEVYDLSPNSGSLLANISTRGFVQTGDNVMIGGFIVVAQPTRVIIRAIGPSLTQFGVPDALANPQLELHDVNSLIAQNDDWQTTQIGGIITSDQVAEIQNSGLAPTNPAESAIIATLQPGTYTAIVRGVNNTTGNALVEVYDLQ
jgi:plastocyanin